MGKIDILGVTHAYDLTVSANHNKNPVLIFIHGWLLSRGYWQPLIDLLSPQYSCLVYDLRGFGESQESSCPKSSYRSYNLASYAQDLSILIEKLEIESAWLIGHSLGGNIALWGARYCSEQVNGVICLNSGGGIYLKEEFERFRKAGVQIVKRRPRWLAYLPLMDLVFARAMVATPLARHWGKQRLLDFLKADQQAAIRSLIDTTTENEVHLLPQIVSQIEQPVYFLAGTKDKIMEMKYVEHLASFHHLFQNNINNVFPIDDCGHLAMLEQPVVVSQQIMRLVQPTGELNLV